MVEIGGRPILWHIMKIYSAHGINDFVVCLGYKGYMIKEYFANYFLHMSDVTIDLRHNDIDDPPEQRPSRGRVTLRRHGRGDADRRAAAARPPSTSTTTTFCFTYGDGVGDVDIADADRIPSTTTATLATVTAVQPPGRFGAIDIERRPDLRASPRSRTATAAGSTAASSSLEPRVFDYIDGDDTSGSAGRWSGCRRRPAVRVHARRLLAADGHPLRDKIPRRPVGRQGARGRSGTTRPR